MVCVSLRAKYARNFIAVPRLTSCEQRENVRAPGPGSGRQRHEDARASILDCLACLATLVRLFNRQRAPFPSRPSTAHAYTTLTLPPLPFRSLLRSPGVIHSRDRAPRPEYSTVACTRAPRQQSAAWPSVRTWQGAAGARCSSRRTFAEAGARCAHC